MTIEVRFRMALLLVYPLTISTDSGGLCGNGKPSATGKDFGAINAGYGDRQSYGYDTQLYKLFFSHTQHAAGLSQVTWVLYALITLLWAIYGLYHKKPAIWVGNALSFVMD